MDFLDTLKKTNALITDKHILYTSGRHGRDYVNKDALYLYPQYVFEFCREMAKRIEPLDIDVILAPEKGAIILGAMVSYHLSSFKTKNIFSIFAEKSEEGFTLKRGYEKIVPNKNILIIEDILTTGSSIKKVVEMANKYGGKIQGVQSLCNRGAVKKEDVGVYTYFDSLINIQLPSWEPKDCVLCKQGIPITKGLGKG
jgi:orotate phosphoribosyltransferase